MGGACTSSPYYSSIGEAILSDYSSFIVLSLCESILQDLKSNNNVKQRANSLLKHLSTHRLYRGTRKERRETYCPGGTKGVHIFQHLR